MIIRVAKVGTRNRVVLPVEVLDALGVDPGDALFFVIRDHTVQLSRSPADYSEYLTLHNESLPAPMDPDDIDPRQMHFGWGEEEW